MGSYKISHLMTTVSATAAIWMELPMISLIHQLEDTVMLLPIQGKS